MRTCHAYILILLYTSNIYNNIYTSYRPADNYISMYIYNIYAMFTMQPRPTPGIGAFPWTTTANPPPRRLLCFASGSAIGDMLKAYNYCFSHGLVYGGACGETRWKNVNEELLRAVGLDDVLLYACPPFPARIRHFASWFWL